MRTHKVEKMTSSLMSRNIQEEEECERPDEIGKGSASELSGKPDLTRQCRSQANAFNR